MKRLVIWSAAFLALAALGADPYAGYIYPAGIQAGTTNRFLVGGQALWNVKRVYFDNPALKVLAVENVPVFPVPGNADCGESIPWRAMCIFCFSAEKHRILRRSFTSLDRRTKSRSGK